MQILHNSMLATYKSKLGALKTEEYTEISIFAKSARSVKIKIENEHGCCIYDMQQLDSVFSYELVAPLNPCVLYYSFIVEMEGVTLIFGCESQNGQGNGKLFEKNPIRFQITVYDSAFKTPDWAKGAVMYQIFPDRFCRGNNKNLTTGKAYHEEHGRKVLVHEDWNEQPLYLPLDGKKDYFPCDFFGGDLVGIEQSLDYLQKLSVNVIYLNPICEASSNHRYDTADYMRVDPILGCNYDFSHLCDSAASRGIKVILDGVFSHTGADSIYFNKQQSYKSQGAFQGKDSEFYPWYSFDNSKIGYKSWWGFETLPEVVEENQSWQRFVITSKNGVFYNWLNMGASGFRLDVADELPDEVITLMRDTLKVEDSENFLLGEVWEDATTKESYGKNRQYALGCGLDSVMNYPFRGNCLNFLQGEITAFELADFLNSQALNYPPQMYYCLMNLISSHDVPRAKTLLATGLNGENMTRTEQAAVTLSDEQDENGRRLLKLATVLQFTIPGMPSIYYGDEQGLDGLKDPFNRGTFVKNNDCLEEFFKEIAQLKKTWKVLNTGSVSFLALNSNTLAILRFNVNQQDYFGNSSINEAALIVITSEKADFSTLVSLSDFEACIEKDLLHKLKKHQFTSAINKLTNKSVNISDNLIVSIKLDILSEGFTIIELK